MQHLALGRSTRVSSEEVFDNEHGDLHRGIGQCVLSDGGCRLPQTEHEVSALGFRTVPGYSRLGLISARHLHGEPSSKICRVVS